jgi:predicted lysophospholipase L1 biosynthesis ABC-type transport system permease subunit
MKKAFALMGLVAATYGTASAHVVKHVVSSKALTIVPEPSSFAQLAVGLSVVFAIAIVARRLLTRAEAN